MVTYLPTILINLTNQATNYIPGTDKYSIIYKINTTIMMVLASIYLSVSASLPTTSASGGLAVVQPGLPFPGDPGQRITTGKYFFHWSIFFYQTYADVKETRKQSKQQQIFKNVI